MKKINVLFCLLLITVNVYAAGSFSSSRSSSSFSKSSSSSTSRSSSFSTNKSTPSSTTSKFSTSSSGGPSSKSNSFSNTKSNTTINSFFNQFKSPASTQMKNDVAKYYNDSRTARRKQFFNSYTPPAYVNAAPASFGIWDSLMLYSILDNIGDKQMYYNHMNDPGMQQWYTSVKEQAKTNEELKAKLDKLDEYVMFQQKNEVSIDQNYIPKNDPDLWVNSTQSLKEINVCTSSNIDGYVAYVKNIQNITKLTSHSIKTNGTIDNISKLSKNECDLAIIQEDAMTDGLIKISNFGFEPALLVCKTPSKTDTVYVSENETGSLFTLNKLKDDINVKNINNSMTTAEAVSAANDNNGCIFTVTNPGSAALKFADSLKMNLVPIKTRAGYDDIVIDGSRYKNLKSTTSIATKTILVTTKNWAASNSEVYDLILMSNIR